MSLRKCWSSCCYDDSSDTCLLIKNNRKQSYQSIEVESPDEHKEAVDINYIEKCVEDIGWNIVAKANSDSIEQWMDHIVRKMEPNVITQSRLESIYSAMRESICDGECAKEMIALLIHTRIFELPFLIKPPGVASDSDDKKSLLYLIALYGKYKYQYKYRFRDRRYLLEYMMDLFEDLSNDYQYNKSVHQFIGVIIPFAAYFTIRDNHRYERDLTFLKLYIDGDNSVTLWAAVILCDSKTGCKHLDTMRQYLDKEVLEEGKLVDDKIIVYMAAIESVANNGGDWTFNLTDYRLIDSTRNWKLMSIMERQPINDSIIKIFNRGYEEDIMKNIRDGSCQTENQKLSIDCLSIVLKNGIISDDNIIQLLSLLDQLRPYTMTDVTATRLVEMIIYHMYPYRKHQSASIRNKMCEICIKYLEITDIIDEIRLSSLLVIINNIDDIVNLPNTDKTVTYLLDVVLRIHLQQTRVSRINDRRKEEKPYLYVIIDQINRHKSVIPGAIDRTDLHQSYLTDLNHQMSVKESLLFDIYKQRRLYDFSGINPQQSHTYLGFNEQEIVEALAII